MDLGKKTALKFVVLLGIVSLFADMTYEGARSITGQYLALLGASGTVVGFVAGLGELIGYGFRLISGYASDKTGKYWLFTFIGYTVNLLAVPLLALADNWPLAASLIVLERFGKALRSPAKDAMLSYASKEVGRGWAFGLHEAMDQVGAVLGPLIVSAVLYFQGSYQMSFALLLIPALSALGVLTAAMLLYPDPQKLEISNPHLTPEGFSKRFWLYLGAIACVAAGYADFPLIAYHFAKTSLIPEVWVPILFALSMGAAGISALVFGHLYDKKGMGILIGITGVAAFFVPLVFSHEMDFAIAGVILWGIGLGAQESIMRAVVAGLVQMSQRATAYGLLNICFGFAWFLGSALMGFLYDVSIPSLILFSLAIQLASLPLFFLVKGEVS